MPPPRIQIRPRSLPPHGRGSLRLAAKASDNFTYRKLEIKRNEQWPVCPRVPILRQKLASPEKYVDDIIHKYAIFVDYTAGRIDLNRCRHSTEVAI
jgi:hypothetical protein